MCSAMFANMLAALTATQDPRQTANLMLYVVGIGALLLSWWWVGALLAAAVAGWLVVAVTAAPDPDWGNYAYTLFAAVVVSVVLVFVRRRQLRLLESARLELRELALVDPLTGLHNRRSLLHLGEQALRSADRAGRRMTLLFIDLDGMKRVNDEDGHAAGDLALQQTARAMQATLRDADVCVRLGGDEFCALLDGRLDDVQGLAGRLRQNLAAQARQDGTALRFGLSVGAAVSTPSVPTTIEDLIQRADVAMYADKQHKHERLALVGA
jgi:diguanylate cyclase (GGDEF)-like protein